MSVTLNALPEHLHRAYDEGVEAGEGGWATEESCPYPVTGQERHYWLVGFQNGRHGER